MGVFLEPEAGKRIPVCLLTGFLGSGKTTLLNHLVQHPEMSNSVIIINEFGDVSLDQHFIESSDGEIVVLANGCMCCTMQGDFEGVIGTLFGKRSRGEVADFDRLVVETTGLADPTSIMQLLFNNPLITKNFVLDAVVTTVDAIHGQGQLQEHDEALKQAAVADRIVITKTDLADAKEVSALAARLSEINPTAHVFSVQHGDIAPRMLFANDAIDPVSRIAAIERRLQATQGIAQDASKDHRHDRSIIASTLVFSEPLEWDSFSRWLNRFKIRHADRLLRVKGIVRVAGEDCPVAIHGVHHVFHPPVRLAQGRIDDSKSYIVFITRGFARGEIEADWRAFDEQYRRRGHGLEAG